ncbi:hypothetical protein TNCV_3994771 [Trichonephila clavipes]|nr:hypothetical protein TNCV_3994771 [Trichonephila clavipes]
MPGFVPYSTSKQAIIAFSDGLRLEMQKFGVSVVTIEPWMFRVEINGTASHTACLRVGSESFQMVQDDSNGKSLRNWSRLEVRFL